ncbi:uncharacterized protein LOC106720103 isoform X2 [Papilio machaon]|uniref:uncharacterized protein LOC106720103 isoform X2 n=1 Tax=Papilio machaon TaxID=76193 RepID=UPI001E665A4A|nr:uncharacterized protein LOC106720103 isoform X2 [Papilio machaon]
MASTERGTLIWRADVDGHLETLEVRCAGNIGDCTTKMLSPYWCVYLSVLLIVAVSGAPVAQSSEADESGKSDVPVEQLEKLKLDSSKELDLQREHVEYHALDAIKEDGKVVSKFEQHASADTVPGEKPQVHAQAQLDIPAAGVHKVVVQDGTHVSVMDATVPTTVASEEQTTKVFHGAARLVQPGSATSANNAANHPPNHSAVRRAYNADIAKENKNNMEHYSYPGVQYSPLDMAEYVFWTGDERGVTTAIEDFLQEGMMTKEEALNFLQEIKFNIEYLRAHYAQNVRAAEEGVQQERLRNILMEQNAKEYQYRPAQFPFSDIRSSGKSWELNNNLLPALSATDLRPEPMKRSYDPMLQTNIISTSDYERDGQIITEEEYEEMMEKLRAADNLYTEYTLEEIIYQLAKMMFSQSLSREPASARAATQRFMAFLELEAERGQLSRTIEKKVLDVMIAALTDTIGDHPELLQPRDALGLSPANKIMHQFVELGTSEPSMSRALLAAYKDELLKGPHKLTFPERN